MGADPTTSPVTGEYSTVELQPQNNYKSKLIKCSRKLPFYQFCVDDRSCTYDLALMKRPLLLTELHRQFKNNVRNIAEN